MTAAIRQATSADAEQILEIYAPVVEETAISFETKPPTLEELRHRILRYSAFAPWLVCCADQLILGYVYASRHREREAYQWSVDVSVYVRDGFRGNGIARALYTSLFACLAVQGFYNAYAGITQPNQASVALHEGMGFKPVGLYRQVGFKLGRWHDVGWWELELRHHNPEPGVPRLLHEVASTSEWREALVNGLEFLQQGRF